MTERDLAAELILNIKGVPGQHMLAGINGQIPGGWYACDLNAHRWDPRTSTVAVFCDAKVRGRPFMIAAGAKVSVDAASADADLLKIADQLASQLRSKIAVFRDNDTNRVRVSLAPGAILPERKTDGAYGYDLCAFQGVQVQPGRIVAIETGVVMELPFGIEVQIRPRSGLAMSGLWLHVSTIDADYRGPLRVIAANLSPDPITINAGDRVAQLVFASVELPRLDLVQLEELSVTGRGDGGLGSTGR